MNQLAAQYSVQTVQSQAMSQAWQKMNDNGGMRAKKEKSSRVTNGLKDLSCKAGQLKTELAAIRKLQETFSTSLNDSIKTLNTQLNVIFSLNYDLIGVF